MVLRRCSNCGKQSDGVRCAFCGQPFPPETGSVTWTQREGLIALQSILGAAILLFAPLLNVPLIGSYNYSQIVFDPTVSGSMFSYIMQVSAETGVVLVFLKAAALLFYATILISIIGLFRKIDRTANIFRWISFGCGSLLLLFLLYLQGQLHQASLLGSYSPIRFGILFGVLFLLAAILLFRRKDVLTKPLYQRASRSGAPLKESVSPLQAGTLVCTNGAFAGARFGLANEQNIIIGRDPKSCQIVMPTTETQLSHKHTLVQFNAADGCYYVTDLSRNGTYLKNGERMLAGRKIRLARGAAISLDPHGDNVFLLE